MEKARRTEAQIALAHEKHQQDCGALRRLETCLDLLKKWVEAQLLVGCSAIAENCQIFHAGKDPLEAGDMRAVYRNVCKRFCITSEIGVTATTVQFVREVLLEERTLPEHLRKMEELASMWDELFFLPAEFRVYGREIISMIFVAGMQKTDRNACMAMEDQAAMVCERMPMMCAGDVDGTMQMHFCSDRLQGTCKCGRCEHNTRG